MTAITGYFYRNTVQLIADSAETTIDANVLPNAVPSDIKSSFFESSDNPEGRYTLESAHKIYNINDRMLVAYAGAVDEGNETIEDIQIQHSLYSCPREFCQDFFSKTNYLRTQYMIGFIENGKPCIFIYAKPNESFLVDQDLFLGHIGIDVGTDAKNLLELIVDSKERSHSQHDMLIKMMAIHQSRAIRNRTLSEGAGGYFNGAFIDELGVHWAKDTAHIMYSGHNLEFGDLFQVFRLNRDNAVFTVSKDLKRVFRNQLTDLSREELITKWNDILVNYVKEWKFDYFVIFGYDINTLIVLNNGNSSRNKPIIEGEKLTFPDVVLQWMHRYLPEEDGAGAIYIENNFVASP